MDRQRSRRVELRSLLLGLVFGFGINLVAADPESWWPPLRLIDRYALLWVAVGVTATVAWEAIQRSRERRRVTWQRTDNPFPGLEPFTAERANVFFGRGEEVRQVVDRLVRSGVGLAQRFVPLVGPSGSGKSSLIQAGVLPRLRASWAVVGPLRPGASPFSTLAAALAWAGSHGRGAGRPQQQEVDRCARLLRDEAARLDRNVGSPDGAGRPEHLIKLLLAVQGGRRRLLVVVDQWEELVTMTSEAEHRRFVMLLHATLAALPSLHVLIATRPEFLPKATGVLYRELLARPYPIGPLEPRRIREVITGPAHAAGVTLEPGLVELMVAEATVGDALPLLGHLLQRLYDHAREDGRISIAMYDDAGRVSGAIAEHADEVYETLAAVYPRGQVDQSLLRFVTWNGQEAVRQTVAAEGLDRTSRRVMEEFRAARLMVDSREGSKIDLAHEALLRQWGTLKTLVRQHEQQLRQRSLLEHRARAWAESGTADDLLRGQALEQARELAGVFTPSDLLAEFITASQSANNREVVRRADQAAEWALQTRHHDRALAVALARAAILELAPTPSAALTLWGLLAEPTTARLAYGHANSVTSMTWLPNGDRLLSVGKDGSICTWDQTAKLIDFASLPDGCTGEALLSQDGSRLLVTEEAERKVSLWDIDGVRFLARSKFRPSGVFAWSADGSRLAGCDYRNVDIWDIDPTEVAPPVSQQLTQAVTRAMVWSPDQTMLAFRSTDTVEVFRVDDGSKISEITAPGTVLTLEWAPDGNRIAFTHTKGSALGALHGMVAIYEVVSGQVLKQWSAGRSDTLAWSPDGSTLATGSSAVVKGEIRLWDVTTGAVARRHPAGHEVKMMAWSGDGKCLAYCQSFGGAITVWDLATDQIRRTSGGSLRAVSWCPDRTRAAVRAFGSADRVVGATVSLFGAPRPEGAAVAWSPTANITATAYRDHIELWDVELEAVQAQLEGAQETVRVLAWSINGTFLASTSVDWWERRPNQIVVWHAAEHRQVAIMEGAEQTGRPLVWSPDSRLLASASDSGRVVVWNAATGEITRQITTPSKRTTALEWSPDQRVLAQAGDDLQIRFWETHTGRLLTTGLGHAASVDLLCWSPDGQCLASASSDHSIRLWAPATGRPMAALDIPKRKHVIELWWSPDGQQLVATTADNTILTWTLATRDDESFLETASTVARELTYEERHRFDLQ